MEELRYLMQLPEAAINSVIKEAKRLKQTDSIEKAADEAVAAGLTNEELDAIVDFLKKMKDGRRK
jgi:hypothetical protein